MNFKFNNLSLRARLVGFFLIVSVLPIAGLTTLNAWTGERRLFNQARKSLITRARNLGEKIDDSNTRILEHTEQLANNPLLTADLTNERIDAAQILFSRWQSANPEVDSVLICDKAGVNLIPAQDRVVIRDKNFNDALDGRVSIGDIGQFHDGAVPVQNFYVPVKDRQGQVKRVLIAQVRATALWDLIDSYNDIDGAGSFAILLDENNIYLAAGAERGLIFHPATEIGPELAKRLIEEKRFGQSTARLLSETRPLSPTALNIGQKPGSVLEIKVPTSSEEHEAAWASLKTKPWRIIMAVPHSSFYSTVHGDIRNSILGGALVMLIVLALGIWLARGITIPLKRLAEGVEQIGQGTLDVRVSVTSHDEIGRLGDLFNEMSLRLQRNINDLEAANQGYRALAGSLEVRVEQRTQDYRIANEQLSRLAKREKLVNQLSNDIRSSLDIDTILGTSVREIGAALGVSRCIVSLFERGRLAPFSQQYHNAQLAPLDLNSDAGSPVAMMAFESGHTVSLADIKPELSLQDRARLFPGARAILVTPIVYRQESLGLISLHECDADRAWTDDDVLLLETVARQMAVAIANARLFRETAEQAVQIEAKNREIEQFVYTVSHDLKAPLVSLQGISQILIEDYGYRLAADGQRYLNRLQSNAHHMEQLIQGLLELSRIGRVIEPINEVDTAIVVRGVVDQFYFQLQERGVKVELDPELPKINCPETRLSQVLANLVGNAIKFIGKENSAPRIEIGGRLDGGVAEFYVRDNGIGIDEQYHSRIFGVFQRLQEVKDVSGTGVGLAIVQKIIDGLGGSVWVESARGAGATFKFRLPDQRSLTEPLGKTDKNDDLSHEIGNLRSGQRKAS